MHPASSKRRERIAAHRCRGGHAYLTSYPRCPECGAALLPMTTPSAARLITHTTVRVNPSGRPIVLGIARTACGASTLCVVIGRIRGSGRDRVTLRRRGGLYYALGSGARLSGGLE